MVNIISVFIPRTKFCLLVLTMTLNHKVRVFDLSKYLKYMYIWLNNATLWDQGRGPYSGRSHIFRISYFHVIIFILTEYFQHVFCVKLKIHCLQKIISVITLIYKCHRCVRYKMKNMRKCFASKSLVYQIRIINMHKLQSFAYILILNCPVFILWKIFFWWLSIYM